MERVFGREWFDIGRLAADARRLCRRLIVTRHVGNALTIRYRIAHRNRAPGVSRFAVIHALVFGPASQPDTWLLPGAPTRMMGVDVGFVIFSDWRLTSEPVGADTQCNSRKNYRGHQAATPHRTEVRCVAFL